MRPSLTRVALAFIPQRINVYLRFGRPVYERSLDRSRSVAAFAPLSVFCRIRWQANEFGTTVWQLAVLQAQLRGENVQRIAGVVPGAMLLLRVDGASRVQAVLRLIDTIEAQCIDPADVSVDYWRLLQNRLAVRADVASYTLDRHAAHLARASLA